MMLTEITREDFAQCCGELFQLELGGKSVTAELDSVTGRGFNAGSSRESFSVLFHAPKQFRYPQSIYRVSNLQIGELEIFLVPLGPNEKGMQLEAIFNFT
jgi:hypothetical protein